MTMTLQEAKHRIDHILSGYRQATATSRGSLLTPKVESGKIYEAWVLCNVLEHLHRDEGYRVTLRESSTVHLKSAPGEINRGFPHFHLTNPPRPDLEVWTDVEFLGLSASDRGVSSREADRCDFHELDVVVVAAGTEERPGVEDVKIGVECKNRPYDKSMLRGMLGVRRELSFLRSPQRTGFTTWPRATVPAQPPSCLLAYGTDSAILRFAPPGQLFGIDFFHEPLP